MRKAVLILYIVSLVLMCALFVLSLQATYYMINGVIGHIRYEAEQAGSGALVYVIIGPIEILFVGGFGLMLVIWTLASSILSIKAIVRLKKGYTFRQMRKLSITQLVFLGNLGPAILVLVAGKNEYIPTEE